MAAKWSLALGGGGMYGIAHLGVLAVLQDEIEVKGVAGTSAGGIAGAFLSAGLDPEEMLERIESMNWLDLFDPTLAAGGLLDSGTLERWLSQYLGEVNLKALRIPVVAVCTELTSGELVVLDEGPVCRALTASSSIPGIFTPTQLDSRVLVDGGVISNVPVGTARERFGDPVLAVNVSTGGEVGRPPQRTHEVLIRSYQLLQRYNSAREAQGAQVVIAPDLSGIAMLDIGRAREIFDRGRQAAEVVLDRIREF